MIDTNNFDVLEEEGFSNKPDAYTHIQIWYSQMKGVTTYYDEGKWYIVQSKALM